MSGMCRQCEYTIFAEYYIQELGNNIYPQLGCTRSPTSMVRLCLCGYGVCGNSEKRRSSVWKCLQTFLSLHHETGQVNPKSRVISVISVL